ncbi:hypothetical protein OHD62_23035 [Mesorhizobium sp. YC-39]|uniref:hypothetical protein n=1 Tax=unclassified Mesorhizobium TaxID=325217 RepID=UPI0021E7C7BE|nr:MULTISPECIES: hypothetical protein [unclassified Mesorhizobium]MCV3209391.1 hypothetical protein [Mesorhizobium sp. YC-2]MCV3231259.1 hypothetical protein [Mesorhizobium sp. YC-39]
MSINRKIKEARIFTPSEVGLFGRVFERAKRKGDSEAHREALASRIVANYMAGITDEAELLALSRQPPGSSDTSPSPARS